MLMVDDCDEEIDVELSASASFFVLRRSRSCSARRHDIFDSAGLVVVIQQTRI